MLKAASYKGAAFVLISLQEFVRHLRGLLYNGVIPVD